MTHLENFRPNNAGIVVAVTGGRDYENIDRVFQELDLLDSERYIVELRHGNAVGADFIAKTWAEKRKKIIVPFRADWKRYKKAAGTIRNKEMLHEGVDVLVSFPGGRGTKHATDYAKQRGITIQYVFDEDYIHDQRRENSEPCVLFGL